MTKKSRMHSYVTTITYSPLILTLLMEKGFLNTPNMFLNNSNFSIPKGLVNILAILSQELQYSTQISLDCTFSLTNEIECLCA